MQTPTPTTATTTEILAVASGDSPAFAVTESGITIRDNLTYEEWKQGLKMFKWASKKLSIAFSDYIKFGENKFGTDLASEAITQLELPLQDVKKAIYISNVPKEIRQHDLSPEHLVVLAKSGLSKERMAKWAHEAKKHNLSPARLKESIRLGVIAPKSSEAKQHGILTIEAIGIEGEVWLRRKGGLQALLSCSEEERDEILKSINVFVQIHKTLSQLL